MDVSLAKGTSIASNCRARLAVKGSSELSVRAGRPRADVISTSCTRNAALVFYCLGDVGEYAGLVGDHFVFDCPGDVGEYRGEVGEKLPAGLVGE